MRGVNIEIDAETAHRAGKGLDNQAFDDNAETVSFLVK